MCRRDWNLEVHHISRTGGAVISNARVLCHPCHTQTDSYGVAGLSPKDFSEATRKLKIAQAKGKCQCKGCDECLS